MSSSSETIFVFFRSRKWSKYANKYGDGNGPKTKFNNGTFPRRPRSWYWIFFRFWCFSNYRTYKSSYLSRGKGVIQNCTNVHYSCFFRMMIQLVFEMVVWLFIDVKIKRAMEMIHHVTSINLNWNFNKSWKEIFLRLCKKKFSNNPNLLSIQCVEESFLKRTELFLVA